MVVPTGNPCCWHNSLEPFDSSRCYTKCRRTCPRQACHGNIAVGPVSLDFVVASLIRVGFSFAVEPFHDILVCCNFKIRAGRIDSIRSFWSQATAGHHCITTNQIVIVPVEVFIIIVVITFIAFTRIDIVPIFWIGRFGYFFCRYGFASLAFGRFFIELGHLKVTAFFETNPF